MKARSFLALTLMFLGSVLVADLQAANLDEDLVLFKKWFTGRFDNHLQVWQEKESDTAEELVHEHIHSIFAPVSVPALGSHVFFVQQYMDGEPQKIYRQRLYRFDIDAEEQAIVLHIYAFKDAKAYANAHLAPDKLKDLTAEAVRATPGCEVYWRRQGDHFLGSMKEGSCRIVSRRSGKTLVISDDLYLDEDEIWIRDKAVDEDGNYVFGHKGNVHHKLKRVRFFKGGSAMKREGQDEDWLLMRGIEMHDQGQRLALLHKDGTPFGYSVELAQVFHEGTKADLLKLAVYKDGEEKSIAYTWVNPEATQVGINMRWFQIGLKMTEPGTD